MLDWLRSRLKRPEPSGPTETVRTFVVSDRPITESGVCVEGDAWRIEAHEPGSLPLFEIVEPALEGCLLTYRAELKTSDVAGDAYLELWCRLPGRA